MGRGRKMVRLRNRDRQLGTSRRVRFGAAGTPSRQLKHCFLSPLDARVQDYRELPVGTAEPAKPGFAGGSRPIRGMATDSIDLPSPVVLDKVGEIASSQVAGLGLKWNDGGCGF